MNARSKPSRFNSKTLRSAGSKACASTPWLRKASSTPVPDSSEISRSELGPPISTATLPNSLMPRPACLLADDAHFGFESHTGGVENYALRVRDQCFDIGCACLAVLIHDEVGVLDRDAGAADRKSFELAGLDETSRVVAVRIAEYGSCIRKLERLRGDASRQQLLDACSRLRTIAWRKNEAAARERHVARMRTRRMTPDG